MPSECDLTAFESESSLPATVRKPPPVGADELDFFPREEPDALLLIAERTGPQEVTAQQTESFRQRSGLFRASLGVLAVVGLATGLWLSLWTTDRSERSTTVATSPSPPAVPATLPASVPIIPAPLPSTLSVAQQIVLPPAVVHPDVPRRASVSPPDASKSVATDGSASRATDASRSARTVTPQPLERSPRQAKSSRAGARSTVPDRVVSNPARDVAPTASSTTSAATTPPRVTPPPDYSREATAAKVATERPIRPESVTLSDTPVEPPPLPPPAPPTPAAAPASPAMTTAARDAVEIEAVLTRYASAFSSLDSAAVSAVWPKVDSRALTRAFRGLQKQDLDFDNCNIKPAATSAEASCRGTVRYVPRIGDKSPRTEQRRWDFSMRKVGERWLIENVNSR